MKFKDEVNIQVFGGDGGNGVVHWRREKYVPRGGPDGGDGGCGGAVILVSDENLNTLLDLAYNPHIRAGHANDGAGSLSTGRDGEDRVVKVPVGTQVFYQDKLVADLAIPRARWVAARGGMGGKGNNFFKNATQQAPHFAQPGRKGESYEFHLILKSVADVGLVGLPNVGKSTLIAALSNARPVIADYPFTTLVPNLGTVMIDSEHSFVIADVPGLIPEAHLGKGLGHTFLRHLERTTVLAQLIDVTTNLDGTRHNFVYEEAVTDEELVRIVNEQFDIIHNELGSFSQDLLDLKRVIVFSKADVPASTRAFEITHKRFEKLGYPVHLVAAKTAIGLEEITTTLSDMVTESRQSKFKE